MNPHGTPAAFEVDYGSGASRARKRGHRDRGRSEDREGKFGEVDYEDEGIRGSMADRDGLPRSVTVTQPMPLELLHEQHPECPTFTACTYRRSRR